MLGEEDEVAEWVVQGKVMCVNGGTGVGKGSASGAKCLNFWKRKRDSESAIWLITGPCTYLASVFY